MVHGLPCFLAIEMTEVEKVLLDASEIIKLGDNDMRKLG